MESSVVFVLSDVRSGSTLLDQCLGAHPRIVSLGEVHWLRAYVRQDRRFYDPDHPLVCSCGRNLESCPFWSAVEGKLGRPLESLHLGSKSEAPEDDVLRKAPKGSLPRRMFRLAPRLFRHAVVRRLMAGPRMAADSIALYDAVAEVTGGKVCVDSSKSPLRFRAVHAARPLRTFAVVLSRDYRAVVHSKMKRGAKMDVAARGWRRKMRQIDVLTGDIPQEYVLHLSYEALCSDPQRELSRVCKFLSVDFHERMLQRPSDDVHHIGGSPSKFDAGRTRIELDHAYEGSFKDGELERLRTLVGNEAARWGYS
jgi:hypothetical protein